MLVTVALDTGSGRVGLIDVFTVRALTFYLLTLPSIPGIAYFASDYGTAI
jgi:hypothetical protein